MPKKVKESVAAEEAAPLTESALLQEPEGETGTAVPPQEAEPQLQAEPAPEPAPRPVPAASGPDLGQRLRLFFNFLLRLILLLIVLGVLSVALYFLLPQLYQKYLVPVQENTTQLQALQARQAQSEQEIAALRDQLTALATQQAESAASLSRMGERVDVIETEIAAHTQSLDALEKMQAALRDQTDASSAELKRQVTMMKAMELLSRARLFMYQSNFGLAKQDAQIARDLLATVKPDAPDSLAPDLDAVLLRLDLTLTNLPDFPVAASDDLDIAWQILLSGLPPAQAAIGETPVPDLTATPTPLPPFTPAPTTTLIPTAAP